MDIATESMPAVFQHVQNMFKASYMTVAYDVSFLWAHGPRRRGFASHAPLVGVSQPSQPLDRCRCAPLSAKRRAVLAGTEKYEMRWK